MRTVRHHWRLHDSGADDTGDAGDAGDAGSDSGDDLRLPATVLVLSHPNKTVTPLNPSSRVASPDRGWVTRFVG